MKKLIVLNRLTAFILQGYIKRILAPDRTLFGPTGFTSARLCTIQSEKCQQKYQQNSKRLVSRTSLILWSSHRQVPSFNWKVLFDRPPGQTQFKTTQRYAYFSNCGGQFSHGSFGGGDDASCAAGSFGGLEIWSNRGGNVIICQTLPYKGCPHDSCVRRRN